MNRSELHERLEGEEDILILEPDDFDAAIIGIAERIGMNRVLAYDKGKCIEVLMKDMSEDEAIEYFDYNTLGAWMGDGTPIFIELWG